MHRAQVPRPNIKMTTLTIPMRSDAARLLEAQHTALAAASRRQNPRDRRPVTSESFQELDEVPFLPLREA
jgi:hypothetical protein